jgi:pimeloyl-ACP methyl ester carboxylesterase
MVEHLATGVGPSGIDVAYERLGDPADPPVLLIMGAGAQLIAWPDGFCAELVGRGLQVIRFDNRDAGRSTHFPHAPEPDLGAARSLLVIYPGMGHSLPRALWPDLASRITALISRAEC